MKLCFAFKKKTNSFLLENEFSGRPKRLRWQLRRQPKITLPRQLLAAAGGSHWAKPGGRRRWRRLQHGRRRWQQGTLECRHHVGQIGDAPLEIGTPRHEIVDLGVGRVDCSGVFLQSGI